MQRWGDLHRGATPSTWLCPGLAAVRLHLCWSTASGRLLLPCIPYSIPHYMNHWQHSGMDMINGAAEQQAGHQAAGEAAPLGRARRQDAVDGAECTTPDSNCKHIWACATAAAVG